jgi:hypothetical protein
MAWLLIEKAKPSRMLVTLSWLAIMLILGAKRCRDGTHYDPDNLSPEFAVDGRRVQLLTFPK